MLPQNIPVGVDGHQLLGGRNGLYVTRPHEVTVQAITAPVISRERFGHGLREEGRTGRGVAEATSMDLVDQLISTDVSSARLMIQSTGTDARDKAKTHVAVVRE